MKKYVAHEMEWQPTRDFVERDGTIDEAFLMYW